ncbi:MAG: restriction endonuclease [Planctomycetota bacterium]
MIRIVCTCGKKFRGPDSARGRTIRCTSCGKKMDVPADAPAAEGRETSISAVQQMAVGLGAQAKLRGSFRELWAALRKSALHLDFLPPQDHLRRCMRCGLTFFGVPEACGKCGSATVGVRLMDVNSGRDREWLVALAAIRAARRRLSLFRRIAFLVFALAAIGGGIALGTRGDLTGWRGVGLAAGALATAAITSFMAGVLTRRALEVLHPVLRDPGASGPPDERLTARLEERFLIPFMQRHSSYRETADLIPPEELDMLVTLLGRNGLALRRDHIYEFLAGCSLRSDYQEFKAEFLRFELSNPDTYAVYASLYPDPGADFSRLPYLLQYLQEGSRPPEIGELLARITTIRREAKLASFEAELDKHAPVRAERKVKLEEVDRIAPANFQLLVALMHQTQGCVVHGMPASEDRPAVTIAEQGDEKTAALGLLSREPVSVAPVRELAQARDYFLCRQAVLVTNAEFTAEATKAASDQRVRLVDRKGLAAMLDAFNAAPRELARLTLILTPWTSSGGEESIQYDVDEGAVEDLKRLEKPREESAAATKEALSYDEADDLIAKMKQRAKAREESERKP